MATFTPSPFPRPSRAARRLAIRVGLPLALATLLPLTACDRSDDVARTIDAASDTLAAINPAGTPAASESFKREQFTQLIGRLQGVADRGTPSQNALAHVMIGQAQSGLAAAPTAEATRLEAQALQTVTRIRSALDQYLVAAARARAAASYDPAPELAEITRADQERQLAITQAQQRRDELKQRVDALRAESARIAAEAKTQANQAGVLRQQAINASAITAEGLLRQARDLTRAAAALENQAAALAAQADNLAPEVPSAELEIARLQEQRELLARAREQVNLRQRDAQTQSADARAKADTAAQDIARLVRELRELRSGDLAKATDDAIQAQTRAAASARRGSQDAKGAAKLVEGAAQQALGELRWNQAHGLQAHAEVLDALAAALPALPDAAAYKAAADEARAALAEARSAAVEAFQAAITAYEGASGNPAAKQRLDELKRRLANSVFTASGGTVDVRPSAAAPDAATAAAPAQPEQAALDLTTAKGVAFAYLDRTIKGDSAGAAELIHFPSDADRLAFQPLIDLTARFAKLDNAVKTRFGTGLSDAMGEGGGADQLSGLSSLTGLSQITPEQIEVVEQGDSAEATIPSLPNASALPLIRVGGQWKVDLIGQLEDTGLSRQQLGMFTMIVGPMNQVIDTIQADLDRGVYASAQDVATAFQQQLIAAMSGMMGGMPGAAPGAAPAATPPAQPGRPGRQPGGGN